MDYKSRLFQEVDALSPQIIEAADDIFDRPEIGLQETYAASRLTELFRSEGFQVETGTAGLPTAFKAVYDNGGSVSVGLLCEYDALEGIGHACGHHMQGPSIFGAAAALKRVCGGLPFRLVVYGTPAEETVGGKITMKERGCFKDIDVALMMHPSPTTTTDVKCMALTTYEVAFRGVSAHAAINPEKGRSALDAVMLMAHGIECLREHVLDDTRIHYTIMNGGGPSNVVPDYASVEICMRSYNTSYLYSVTERVQKIIHGAAMMTETEAEISEQPFFQAKIPVLSLNKILMDNAAVVDAPTIRPPREKTGSTDFGNVMYDVPGSCIRVAFVPEGTSSHSQQYIDSGKSREAHECTLLAAKILAASAFDLISDPDKMDAVRNEFRANKAKMENNI